MALTRMPWAPSSWARQRVIIQTAALEIEYTPAVGRFDAIDASVTIDPPCPASIISCAARWHVRNTPRRLMPITKSKPSMSRSVSWRMLPLGCGGAPTPADATTVSTPPISCGGAIDGGPRRGRIAHVDLDEVGCAARGLDASDHVGRGIRGARQIGEHDSRAFSREQLRRCGAEPVRSAGDDRPPPR